MQAGGVERHIINLVKSIDPLKIEPTVVLFRQDASMALLPSIAPYARVVVFPASHVDASSIVRERSGFASLISFLRSFDVAFSFYLGGVDDLIGIDAAAMAGVPVSIAYVGWTVQGFSHTFSFISTLVLVKMDIALFLFPRSFCLSLFFYNFSFSLLVPPMSLYLS